MYVFLTDWGEYFLPLSSYNTLKIFEDVGKCHGRSNSNIYFFKYELVRLITTIPDPFLAKWRGKFYQLMAVWWPAWKELVDLKEHNREKWSHHKMWHHSLAPAGVLGMESKLHSQPWIFPSRNPWWLTRGQCAVIGSTASYIGCLLWKSQGQIIRSRQQARK